MFEIEVHDLEMARIRMEPWDWNPTKIVTMLDNVDPIPSMGEHHLRVSMSDISHEGTYYPAILLGTGEPIMPNRDHLAAIMAHTVNLEDSDRVLIHCWAGQSRSTAGAIGICINNGMHWKDAFHHVEKIRPIMLPNTKIIGLIDDYFSLGGELIDYHFNWMQNALSREQLMWRDTSVSSSNIDEMKNILSILSAPEGTLND